MDDNKEEEIPVYNQVRKIEFDYINRNGERSHRIVVPSKIFFLEKGWVLEAFELSSKKYKFFKLRSISNWK
jgi:predicted DNA-binding transcriptional regulator YafY